MQFGRCDVDSEWCLTGSPTVTPVIVAIATNVTTHGFMIATAGAAPAVVHGSCSPLYTPNDLLIRLICRSVSRSTHR